MSIFYRTATTRGTLKSRRMHAVKKNKIVNLSISTQTNRIKTL